MSNHRDVVSKKISGSINFQLNQGGFRIQLFPKILTLAIGVVLTCSGTQAVCAFSNYKIKEIPGYPKKIGYNGLILAENGLLYDSLTGTGKNIRMLATGEILTNITDVNSNNQVVGAVRNKDNSYKFVIRNANGTMIDLGSSPNNPRSFSRDLAINNAGVIVGHEAISRDKGFITNQTGTGLSALELEAVEINSKNQVVGTKWFTGTAGIASHAAVTTSSGIKDLHQASWDKGTYPSGSLATAINDTGLVTGYHYISTLNFSAPAVGVIWDTNRGTYKEFTSNFDVVLSDINASGQIIGRDGDEAVVGNATEGLAKLNTLVPGILGYWIRALDINDEGQILVAATVPVYYGKTTYYLLTPDNKQLAPSGLTPAVASSTGINLNWTDNAASEAAQYLERCAGVSCNNFIAVATLASSVTHYSDTGLTAGMSYRYRLRSTGAAGSSAYSNIATTTIAAPIAPTKLTSGLILKNKITLLWADNGNNEAKFLIERCLGLNCTNFSQIATTEAKYGTFANLNLTANTDYQYRVRAMNALGNSGFSNVLSSKTLP